MTRTAIYKGVYFGLLAGTFVITLIILAYFRFSPRALIVAIVCLLIPGRILGFFWRDLLRGLRLLNAKQFAQSKYHSERFLAYVRQQPWIKKLIWLGSSSYSRDPEVLALNNLGAAEIQLGELDAARKHLASAIAMDSLCPLPYFNMGVLSGVMDDPDEADRWYVQAARLGFTRGLSDKIVRAAQSRFANTDGR